MIDMVKAMARKVLGKLAGNDVAATEYLNRVVVHPVDDQVCLYRWRNNNAGYKQGFYLVARADEKHAYIVSRRVFDGEEEPHEFRRLITRNRAMAIIAFIERNSHRFPDNTDLGNTNLY